MSSTCPSPVAVDAPQCPMRAPPRSDSSPTQCPIPHDVSIVNPRNNMPFLPQSRAPKQIGFLPSNRTISSIPRTADAVYGASAVNPVNGARSGETPSNWEYPSPQQFYNALVRKGWDTPEEYVEAMVLLHNNLNEDAWAEVLQWETQFGGGAIQAKRLELAEFAGIHTHMSHKARLYQLGRRYFPSQFPFTPPFDRHDWIVRRPQSNKKIRYVIDYYASRKSARDEPVFHLDVRPAMDSFGNVMMRLRAQAWRACSTFRLSGSHTPDAVFICLLFSLTLAAVGISMA